MPMMNDWDISADIGEADGVLSDRTFAEVKRLRDAGDLKGINAIVNRIERARHAAELQERITQLKAENAALRELAQWLVDDEMPDYVTLVALRAKARALFADR
jgi:hypothetical protein